MYCRRNVPRSLLLFAEDFREFFLPTEGFVAGNGWIVDERVAAFDVVVERVQFAVRLGGTEPERKLGNLYALLVDVDTKQVVFQDRVLDVGEHDGRTFHFCTHFID